MEVRHPVQKHKTAKLYIPEVHFKLLGEEVKLVCPLLSLLAENPHNWVCDLRSGNWANYQVSQCGQSN